MERDYYAFRQAQLSNSLNELGQAAAKVEQAKDKNARQQAKGKMKQAANKAVKIDPHLAYLWYEAGASELDNSIRDAWQERLAVINVQQEHKEHFDFRKIPDAFRLAPNVSDAADLPPLSFLLCVPFRLQKPYLSKDERDFYLLDNLMRREKIFQTPMLASTSWKGALRGVMVQQLAEWWCSLSEESRNERSKRKEFVAKRVQSGRLFGTERDVQVNDSRCKRYLDKMGGNHLARWYRRYVRRFISSTSFFAGRLHFYSTFFDKISLEVINPHSRATGVGERGPILMECVPQGTAGDLVVLYVPFGPIGQSEADRRAEVAQDLEVLTEGIQAMLTIYGFGAKTSSGFGIADERLPKLGTLALRAELPSFTASPEPAVSGIEQAQAEIAQFVARQGLQEFPRWTKKELEQSNWGAKKQSEYKRLRKRHPGWDDQANAWREPVEEVAPAPSQMPTVTIVEFETLSKLRDLAQS